MRKFCAHIVMCSLILPLFPVTGNHPAYSFTPEPDKIFVHLDKSFYVAGESIHYKIYFLNERDIDSKIVHVDLVDAQDSVKIEQIVLISDNTASGEFRLPVSFREGNYLFRCYTTWNINFGNEYIFYKTLPVYNEWLTGISADKNMDYLTRDTARLKDIKNQELNVNTVNCKPIHARDTLSVEIQTRSTKAANLSVTVFDLNLIQPLDLNQHDEYLAKLKRQPMDEVELRFDPEASILVQGSVKEPRTGDPITSNVLSLYNKRDFTFTRIKSKDGVFSFKLPLFHGKANLQLMNMNPYQEKVPLVQTRTILYDVEQLAIIKGPPERTPEVNKYLYFSKLRRHFREIFYQDTTDSLQLVSTPYLQFLPDKSYDMGKYRYIKNMGDFIHQAVTNAGTYKEGDSRKILLFNNETKKYFMTKPWLLVDNYFIFNDSLVYNIPFTQIKRIDLYITNRSIFKYFEPIMVQGGVIAIYTKNNFLSNYVESSPNMLEINGLQNVQNEESSISYPAAPDLEPLIFWQADLKTDENGFARLNFQTNNITGHCMIQLIGMDENGNLLEGKYIYQVTGE